MKVSQEGEGLDGEGRYWQRQEDGTWEKLMGGMASNEARSAFALRRNVEAFTEYHERRRCGFLTLTAKERDITPREFGAIWDEIRKHDLAWVVSYIRVLEPQKRGTPHYHLLVSTPYDLHPETFDWDAYLGAAEAQKRGDVEERRRLTKQYAQSACPELRRLWAELREICERHGLGRSEFLPFRKEAGAVAEYVGKYLESGLAFRRPEWKGARRVEYDRKASKHWKACTVRFGWVSPGAAAWRNRVGEVARAVGADDLEGLRRVFGSKWGYRLRGAIMTSAEAEWRDLLFGLAREHGGSVARKPKLTVGGEVVAWWDALEDHYPF